MNEILMTIFILGAPVLITAVSFYQKTVQVLTFMDLEI